jgi:carbamoyltransferase
VLILGIAAFYHDSAAALLRDGEIIAAAQEERFTRRRHDASFPEHAIYWCLTEGRIKLCELDYIVFYEKPLRKFERLVQTYIASAPRGFDTFREAMAEWLTEKLYHKRLLRNQLRRFGDGFDWKNRILFSKHHLSHAASAFFASPYDAAAILTLDGVGEFATTAMGLGKGNSVRLLKEIHFPHSLGLLYSTFTSYAGFRVNSGEYKLMGLAPYGTPRFAKLIFDHLIDVRADGSYRLDLKYFDYPTGRSMFNSQFEALLGGPPRRPETPVTQRDADIAASIQAVLEDVVIKMTRFQAAETGMESLCLAGGVALNCVANGAILRDGRFRRVWIQPAAGDAGGALGAALAAYHLHSGRPRPAEPKDIMKGAFLGPSFPQAEIEQRLTASGAIYERLGDADLLSASVETLIDEKALGWFQGRMEFGPRALGARSILADPRSPRMQSLLNLKVKFRESFRPFAPSILREDLTQWFELDCDSPYMLLVCGVAAPRRKPVAALPGGLLGSLDTPRSEIPAVTHVDFSARVQTVDGFTNPRYYALIRTFKDRTGCPVLVNTSFNVRGEPIVHTPEEAFRCFMATDMDALAIGNCFLRKEPQRRDGRPSYVTRIPQD